MDKIPSEIYREKHQRVRDALDLKVPDRVPTLVGFGLLPAKYTGMTAEEAFYDVERWTKANRKTITDFQPDMFMGVSFRPGAVFEAIDTKVFKWPGHGV